MTNEQVKADVIGCGNMIMSNIYYQEFLRKRNAEHDAVIRQAALDECIEDLKIALLSPLREWVVDRIRALAAQEGK